ncbi:hypothetical protein WME73_47040 [Sorangium sp. So ce302]|uniref:hypothetical protein n=1 Tax=unclassified Sorangium TaxID=2621164 RepID=UPI003F6475FE
MAEHVWAGFPSQSGIGREACALLVDPRQHQVRRVVAELERRQLGDGLRRRGTVVALLLARRAERRRSEQQYEPFFSATGEYATAAMKAVASRATTGKVVLTTARGGGA